MKKTRLLVLCLRLVSTEGVCVCVYVYTHTGLTGRFRSVSLNPIFVVHNLFVEVPSHYEGKV